jgi:hypothetical protein
MTWPITLIPPQDIATPINLSSFSGTLPDNDEIGYSAFAQQLQRDEVLIRFGTTSKVTWVKEIAIYTLAIDTVNYDPNRGAQTSWTVQQTIQTKNEDHGWKNMTAKKHSSIWWEGKQVSVSNLLVFSKGKFLGVLTPIYQISLDAIGENHRLEFLWRKD